MNGPRGGPRNPLTVLVVAKAPVAGQVKTRLSPPLVPVQCAELAAAALSDTVAAVSEFAGSRPGIRPVLALAGDLESACGGGALIEQLTPPWRIIPQRGTGFAQRLAAAHADAAGSGAVLQIGMDTPQVSIDQLTRAATQLDQPEIDAVLGPAPDGGWWILGLRNAQRAAVLADVPMSTDQTLMATQRALAGLRIHLVESATDVDDIASARDVARAAPHTHFASVLARFGMLEGDRAC